MEEEEELQVMVMVVVVVGHLQDRVVEDMDHHLDSMDQE